MDFEVQRSSRHCCVTGRELREGETFFSVLVNEGREIRRHDYSAEAWPGPPRENVIAWWKSQAPHRHTARVRMAPNDALLEYFQELEDRPEAEATLYVLALLLIRRRVLRLEDRQPGPDGRAYMTLYCPRDESTHRVADEAPSDENIAEIERQLAEMLYAGVESS